MKKKSLVVSIVLVMLAAMIGGCGASKKDYANDVAEMQEFGDAIGGGDDMEAYAKAADGMDMKTPEGKVLKKDMQKLGDYMDEFAGMLEDYENIDEDAMNDLYEKITTLQTEVEEHSQDFIDAAEKSGLSEDDLSDLGLDF